jgi:adenine deaminase
MVIVNGEAAAEAGRLLLDLPAWTHEPRFRQSVHIPRRLAAEDFGVAAGQSEGTVTANVIGVLENQAPTRHLTATLQVTGGVVQPDLGKDVLPLALVERHRGAGTVVNGFVHGFGFAGPCAVASTVAHDSHHLLVAGTSPADMARAVNTLADVGGGVVVVRAGEVTALVELPVGGLMSAERAEAVAEKSAQVMQAMRDCGCPLNNGYMQLSLLALVVIPELRISDLGLVDVSRFAHVPVIR